MKNDIIKFLLGEESFDGVWFGEKHPKQRGLFWWRKHLRKFINDNEALCKTDVGSNHFLPSSCKGVKCMVKGCQNLSSHKVGEQNIWCNMDGDWNDEKEKHKEFNMKHNLTSYLCDEHFDLIMSREENVSMEDNRFDGRSL